MSSRLCPGGFAFCITWNFEWNESWPLDNLVNSRTGTIVFSAKGRLLLMQNALLGWWGGFPPCWFDRLPSISFALRAVHEKIIQSKPFMFAQNFSVCECKFQLSSAVHGVILSSRCIHPWNRYWGPFQTPLHSFAEPNWRVKYGRRAAFESVWLGRLGLLRQTTLGPVQTPLHSSAEPNLIKFDFSATLERQLVQTAYLRRT